MPEVNEKAEFSATLVHARQMASFESRRPSDGQVCRRIAMILPTRQIGAQNSAPVVSAKDEMIKGVERILPSGEPANVIAIAFTDLKPDCNMQDLKQALPFLGFLLGFAYLGHNVVVFEGHPSALAAGLSGADLLVVDAEMIPFLQEDWLDVAFKVMRKPEIRVYQPNGQVQQVVRKAS